jgi:hypothetical protein
MASRLGSALSDHLRKPYRLRAFGHGLGTPRLAGLVLTPSLSVSFLRRLGSAACALIAHIPWGRSVGGTDCPDCLDSDHARWERRAGPSMHRVRSRMAASGRGALVYLPHGRRAA